MISSLVISLLSSEGLKHSFLQSLMTFSLSALERPKSGQPDFCLKEPTAFTSKIGFSESFVLDPIGIRPSLELIRSNHSKIRGPLVA